MSENENADVQYTVASEDGKQYGPMGLEELKTLVRDNRVGPDTEVLDSTTREWHAARLIEELSEFFPDEIVAPAPPPQIPPAGAEDATVPRVSLWAIASMWCGIISVPTFCCAGWILAIVAVVLGLVARSEIRQTGCEGIPYTMVGIICGCANLAVTGILGLMFGGKFIDVLKQLFEQYG